MSRAVEDDHDFHRRLLSASGLVIAAYAEDGTCVFVNDALLRVVGGTREQHLASNFRRIDSWRQGGMLGMAERTLATGEETLGEVRLTSTYGRDIRLEVHLARFLSAGRAHLLAMARDITAQRLAEAALRESEEKYRKVTSLAGDAILLADADTGILLEANRKAEEMIGLPADRIAGLHQSEVHPLESREEHRADFRERADGGGHPPGEIQMLHRDGRRVPAEVSTSVFELGGRRVIVGIFRDLSERKRAEEERRNLEEHVRRAHQLESLGLLAGGIAHDFNNLLMSILGNAELIRGSLCEECSQREYLEDVLAAARQASQLCREVLVSAGKTRGVREAVDLRAVAAEMIRVLRVSTPRNVRVELGGGEVPTVHADATQMRQVTMNLIKNAIEAIGEREGTITVLTGEVRMDRVTLARTYVDDGLPEGGYARLEVADTGCGMDAVARTRAFEPFFSTKATGRGLGMAVVLGVVRAHGGAIQVDSEPGRGTRVQVFLPVA